MIRLQPTKIELSPKDVADACSRIERRRELQATLAYESYSSTISTPATILSQNVTHSLELERKFEQLKIRTDPTSVSGETWRRSPDVFPPPNEESSAAILEASTSSSVYREQVITQGLGSMRWESLLVLWAESIQSVFVLKLNFGTLLETRSLVMQVSHPDQPRTTVLHLSTDMVQSHTVFAFPLHTSQPNFPNPLTAPRTMPKVPDHPPIGSAKMVSTVLI